MKLCLTVLALLALALPAAAQDEIRVLTPGANRMAMGKLAPMFEAKTHLKLAVTFQSAAETRKSANSSDDFDAMVLQPPLEDIIASGHVVAASRLPLANVPIGLIVKTGGPHPDISTPAKLKAVLLAAKSIVYPDPKGPVPVGPSFHDTLVKLGIDKEVDAKSKYASGGPATVDVVRKGEADFGVDFVSEAKEPGIEIVGAFPAGAGTPPQLVGFVTTKARNPANAKALLQFLASSDAEETYKAAGMTLVK